jgi:RHS repeat-associated protein
MITRRIGRLGLICLIWVCALLNFSGVAEAYVLTGGTPPQTYAAAGEQFTALAAGLFTYSKTDLTVAAPMPISVTRVYRSEDKDANGNFVARDFGLGTRLNYNIFLHSNSEVASGIFTDAQVIMPDGARISCQRTSPCNPLTCTDYANAVFTCSSQPTGVWFGSTISYNASTPGWDLKRKDGTVYSFGLGAPLQKITDRYGNHVTITHSSGQSGKITRVDSSNGRYVTFAYVDPNNPDQITSATDNSGRIVQYDYNLNRKLKHAIYASFNSNASTEYEWEAAPKEGDIRTIILNVKGTTGDLKKNFNYITYKTNGRLASVSSQLPDSGYQYNYFGSTYVSQVNVTLPDNSVRSLLFNSAGYATDDRRAFGLSIQENTSYTRNANNFVTSTTDALGRQTSYAYDNLGNVTSVTHTPGPGTTPSATTTYTYEPVFNRVASIDAPLTPPTIMTYNDASNPTSATITDPVGRTTTLTYNTKGQVASVQDPLLNTSLFTYDLTSGDQRTVTDPLANQTTYATDSVGRVTSVTTPLGNQSQISYDALDNVLSATDADGKVTSYQYNLLGVPSQMTDARGNVTTITVGATLDVTTICDAGNHCSTENRNAMGRKTTFIDKRNVKTLYNLDKLGRITSVVHNSTNLAAYDQRTITYTYDAADRVTSITDTGSAPAPPITYTYDGMDNVLSQATPQGTVTYTYDANGRRTGMTKPGFGNQIIYTYYNDGQIQSITAPNASASIVLDAGGRRGTLTVNNVTTTYGYDNASRLTALSYVASGNPLGNLTYAYDNDSRIIATGGTLARTNLPAAAFASYSNTNQVSSWSGVPATVDNASNITIDPTNSAAYKWDSRNMLSQVNPPLTTFKYDALGRRESLTSGSDTSSYLYDLTAAARIVSGTVTKNVLTPPGSGEVLAYSSTSGSTTTTWTPIHDQIGSTVALVDSSGAMSTQYTYEPFGRTTFGGASNSFPFQFAGMELDSATGLYQAGGRYYSTRLQRLAQQAGATGSGGGGAPGAQGSSGGGGPGSSGGGGSGGLPTTADVAVRAEIGLVAAYASYSATIWLLTAAAGASADAPPVAAALVVAAAFTALVETLLDAFDVFGSGEVEIPRELQHKAHTIQPLLLGDVRGKLVWSQDKVEEPRERGAADPPLSDREQRCRQAAESEFYWCLGHLAFEAFHVLAAIAGSCVVAVSVAGPAAPVGALGCTAIAGAPAAIGFGVWGYGCYQNYQTQVQRCAQ